jgi:DNA-binding PadR family transcriptional regulator
MSSIRLLILGVMLRKQPIHGYEVRRELELWDADRWANIAYGSIYSALNKMAEDGLVEPVSAEQHARTARTEYIVTERGKGEFERLLREYWWEPKPLIDPFQIALTFMDRMPHDELLAALRYRADLARSFLSSVDYLAAGKTSGPGAQRHIAENIYLLAAHVQAELRWTEAAIAKVERGDLP